MVNLDSNYSDSNNEIKLNLKFENDDRYYEIMDSEESSLPKEELEPNLGIMRTRANKRAGIDVGIVNIWEITTDPLKSNYYPGDIIQLNVTLKNYDNSNLFIPFLIDFNVSDDGNPQYFNASSKLFPTCIGQSYMKANTSYNVSWNWTVPKPDEMPPGSKNDFSTNDVIFTAWFSINLSGDKNSSNDKKSLEIQVRRPAFKVKLIPGWYVYTGSKWEYIHQGRYELTIYKGQINQFELKYTLVNLGDPTYINYSIVTPTDWSAIPPTRRFWETGANSSYLGMNLSVKVFPSTQLEYLPGNKLLYIKLIAVCEYYPDIVGTLEFSVKVNYLPNPVIKVPSPPIGSEIYFVTPGFAFINFKLYNMGNDEDNFITTAEVGTISFQTKDRLKDGWRAVVHSGKYTKILGRGEFQNITVKVTVPSTVPIRSSCPIKLSAISIKHPEHLDAETNESLIIYTDEFNDLSFCEPLPEKLFINPDSEVSTFFKVRNTGNTRTKNIKFSVSNKPNSWDFLFDTSDIPIEGLLRNGTAAIEVIIKTPMQADCREFDINITAILNDNTVDEITVPVQINVVYGIGLSCKNTHRTGNISEGIKFPITIKNLGNAMDCVELSYLALLSSSEEMDWDIELEHYLLPLDPFESRVVNISLVIPEIALADTNFLTPLPEGYKFRIIGISQNNTRKRSEGELEVLVNPIYNFTLNKQTDKKNLIMHQRCSVDYRFNITNLGNALDVYHLSYTSEYAWITLAYSQRRLLPSVTEELLINFDTPWLLDAGIYVFNLICSSMNDPTLIRELELTIEIIEFDLAITELRLNDVPFSQAKVKENDVVKLNAKLENIGELNYSYDIFGEKVFIKFKESSNYIGEANITKLGSKKTGDNYTVWVSVIWKVGKARSYKIIVELDPNMNLPESTRSNNIINQTLKIEHAKQQTSDDKEVNFGLFLAITISLILVIILIVVWLMLRSKARRLKKGYTREGTYQPFEKKKEPKLESETDLEEEPEGGVLTTSDELQKGTEEREKFLSERLEVVAMKPIDTMKPIQMMEPIKETKPLRKDEEH